MERAQEAFENGDFVQVVFIKGSTAGLPLNRTWGLQTGRPSESPNC